MASPDTTSRPVLPESFGYRLKKKLLGGPIVTERLSDERLSKPIALGVLSPDCISSSAYGTEEMLHELVPYVGLAAFSLVVPITISILIVLFLVTLSYREVVMIYTKAGGSYVVARDNFGPRVAQISAVALLIDYTVTVAVQSAAGTDALTSAFSVLSPYTLPITVGIVVLLVYGNLRGLKEAGKAFAVPTFLFIFAISAVIIIGVVKEALGDLGMVHASHGAMPLGHHRSSGLLMGASVLIILRSFANGGSSLTGLEAISNGVGAFQAPEGRNARKTLMIMSGTLGFLVLGVTMLAHWTHAIPYSAGNPTVISQEAKVVLGSSAAGHVGYYLVQATTLLILWTGANTSFNGFPFLASFVAEDRFLPRALTKRGHRLAFSNGIIVLAVISIGLLVVTNANVNSLVAVYAIGVFTGFTMAGVGMVKHHLTHKESKWQIKLVINGLAGIVSFVVVIIFAVTKFTQGAWMVVVIFPLLFVGLLRLNRQYRLEAQVLGEGAAERAVEAKPLRRHVAFVLVDAIDMATARAVQYARTMSVDDLRAIHFVVETARARSLQARWVRLGLSHLPLELVECQDRRLMRAAMELAADASADGETEVTVLLPRRAYNRIWNRFLHDQTADRLGAALSQVPHVNATIVPFDVEANLEMARRVEEATAGVSTETPIHEEEGVPVEEDESDVSTHIPGTEPISSLHERERARVAGRVHSMTVQPWGSAPTLECVVSDESGRLTIAFLGRREIAGIEPGSKVVLDGTVARRRGKMTMINPEYEIVTGEPAKTD